MNNIDCNEFKHLYGDIGLESLIKEIMNKITMQKKHKSECELILKTAKDILQDVKDKNLMLSNNDV